MIFQSAENFEERASLFKIILIFGQMILRVNLVPVFTYFGEWAKISTPENVNR